MRLIIIIGLTIVLLFMLIKPLVKKEKGFLLFPAILSIIITLLGFGEARWLFYENVGTGLVKEISANPNGYLHCQRMTEGLADTGAASTGYVSHDQPNRAVVKYTSCQQLIGWFESDRQTATEDQMKAVTVFIHESYHVSGDYDETSTECKTRATLDSFVTKYANEKEAVRFTEWYDTQVYPNLRKEYRSYPCPTVP